MTANSVASPCEWRRSVSFVPLPLPVTATQPKFSERAPRTLSLLASRQPDLPPRVLTQPAELASAYLLLDAPRVRVGLASLRPSPCPWLPSSPEPAPPDASHISRN